MTSSSSHLINSNHSDSSSIVYASGRYYRVLSYISDLQMIEVFLAFLVFLVLHSLRKRRHEGLPSWPFLGMLPSLVVGVQGNIYEWISQVLHSRNGTFTFRGPWFTKLNCVITSDPRNVEYLLKSNFTNFPKGNYFKNTVKDLLGDGIFNADDDVWQKQRKTTSLQFHSAKFRQMTTDSLRELVHERLNAVLDDFLKSDSWFDMQDVLLRLTFDNVCMIAFGVDPGCLRPGLPDVPFACAFEAATEAIILRFVTPTLVWKTMRYLELGSEGKLKKSIERVDGFAEEVIRARRRESVASSACDDQEKIAEERSDLLTVFMGLKDEECKPFSDKFLRDICVNFILAGRDTSSVALSWFFWLLHCHPEVEKKIVREIDGIALEKERRSCAVFTPEEVKRMNYLQAALSEALRLYPSVPVDHKEVLEDDEFPDGTVLKKGTKVVYAIYAMGRMEGVWGKDCREFKPERWLRDGTFVSESAYKFASFNGGPRLCLGKDFAYYQMKLVAAFILWRYKVVVAENHPVEPRMALTMYMKHGLKVQILSRDHACLQNSV